MRSFVALVDPNQHDQQNQAHRISFVAPLNGRVDLSTATLERERSNREMSNEDSENKMQGGIAGWFTSSSNKQASNDRDVLIAKRPGPATPTAPNALDESYEDDSPDVWSPTKGSTEAATSSVWNQQLGDQLTESRAVANHRNKNQRDSKIQEKRTGEKKVSGSAHPMSKSLFRVGTSQPNHKRPVDEVDAEDESPEEKRMRLDEDSKPSDNSYMPYVGVVVVAIAAVLVLTLRRRKA